MNRDGETFGSGDPELVKASEQDYYFVGEIATEWILANKDDFVEAEL